MSTLEHKPDSSYETNISGGDWDDIKLNIHGVSVNGELKSVKGKEITENYEEILSDVIIPRFCINDLCEGNVVYIIFSNRVNKTPYRVNTIENIEKNLYNIHLEPYDKRANSISFVFTVNDEGRIDESLASFSLSSEFEIDDNSFSSIIDKGDIVKNPVSDISMVPDEILLYTYDKISNMVVNKI